MRTPDLLKQLALKHPVFYELAEVLGLKKDYEIKCFIKEIRRGMVVYDIGANVGRFSKLFSMLVGPKGQVHAFEPIGINFSELGQLEYPQLNTYKIALWHESGESEIYYPKIDGAQGSLKKQDFGNWSKSEEWEKEVCGLEPLDRFIAGHNIPEADFIKIDAEGAELNILKGGCEFLRRKHPMLFIELNEKTINTFGHSLKDVWEYLLELHYNRFTLVGRQYFQPIPDFASLENALKKDFSPSIFCTLQL